MRARVRCAFVGVLWVVEGVGERDRRRVCGLVCVVCVFVVCCACGGVCLFVVVLEVWGQAQ